MAIVLSIFNVQESYKRFNPNHEEEIRAIKNEFMVLIRNFENYLDTVIKNCFKNFHVLSNIISELNIAEASGAFDLIILSEIHDNCEKLIASHENEQHSSRMINGDISALKIESKMEKKLIMNESLERADSVALARFATKAGKGLINFQGYHSESLHSRRLALGGLAILVGALIRFINHCSTCGLTKLVNDLRQIENKMTLLTNHIKSLEDMAVKHIQYPLENYLDSINKGIKYHSFDGERTKEQARKMIRETNELKSGYLDIGDQASQTRLFLRNIAHTR